MKRTPFYLFLALLTFVVGISLTALWLFKSYSSNGSSDEKISCVLALANKFTPPPDKAYSSAELAGLYSKAGDMETARNLLSDALEIAKSIEEPLNQAGAIWRISEVGELEHLEKALTIARTVKDSKARHRIWAYRELSEHFIRLERRDRAKSVLDEAILYLRSLKYDDQGQKELDLSFLGQLYAQAGFCSDALKTSPGFENQARISEIKRETAVCLATNKQIEPAFATAKTIENYWEMKVEAFLGMASVFLETNNEVLVERALAEALKVARRKDWSNYDSQQASAFVKIVDVYRAIGKDKESLKILEEAEIIADSITNPNFKKPANAEISKKFAKMHLFDKALKIALPIKDPTSLAEIAKNMFEADNKETAQEILNQSHKLPNQTPNSLVSIAEIYALNGFQQQTMELLERVKAIYAYKNDYFKNSYPERIVSTYIILKEYDAALEFASRLEDPEDKLLAVAAIEIEMNNAEATTTDKTQKLFSQLGCTVK